MRNPVVGEDDITQFILARSFNTSWPVFLLLLEIADTFYIKSRIKVLSKHGHKLTHGGLVHCLRNFRGNT